MAKKNSERRMVFDTGGRRKNVVKVVYAILAVLMGLSLLLVVGPAPLQDIFGVEDSVSSAADQFEEQAERVEQKLKKDPENADLLLTLTRAQINAGNAMVESNPETGQLSYTTEARQQLLKASETWSKYLKATDEPNPAGAQVAAQSLFALAEISRTGAEAEANVRAAAAAQAIVGRERPSLGSLSTLAIYRLFAFDYAGGKRAEREAAKYTNTKLERKNLSKELEEISKRAHSFEDELAKIEKEAKKAKAEGQPSVANPLAESNPLTGP